jgi:hypothetical protein
LPLKDSVTIATVTTKRGARTIAVDEQTHLIYLPTAEFEAPDPNTPMQDLKLYRGLSRYC